MAENEGLVAIVTGASSGIGEATARALSEVGFSVALAARREDRLQKLSSELGEHTIVIPTDISDAAACEALVARTIERFGRLDILVNNAAVGYHKTISEGEPEEWRMMFESNVLGTLYTTRVAARQMLEQGSGHVVFVSSVGGRRVSNPRAAVYSATKHAITAICEGLRMDVSPRGVRVTAVEPGGVQTEFIQNYRELEYEPLQPRDVAAAILYAITQPAHVNVNEILVRPVGQQR